MKTTKRNIRMNEADKDRLKELVAWGYARNISAVMLRAIFEAWQRQAAVHDDRCIVVDHTKVLAASPCQCDACGAEIQVGQVCYLQRWSDGRPGGFECVGCQ